MYIINKCNPSSFIPNAQEIRNYFHARKQLSIISNTSRLINIIKIYFETLLFYQQHSSGKFYINIKGKLYKFQIEGHDEKGLPLVRDLTEIAEPLITNTISDIKKTINIHVFEQLIDLLNAILQTPRISTNHKIAIINSENKVFTQEWQTYVRSLPEEIAIQSLRIRKTFIFNILQSPKEYLPDLEYLEQNLNALYSAYEFYVKTLIKVYIAKNRFVDIISVIHEELHLINKHVDNKDINVDRLITFLLIQLVLQNNLFQLEQKDIIETTINEYIKHIEQDKLKVINNGLHFNPNDFEIKNYFIELVEPIFSGEDLDKIKTLISFVVPYSIHDNSISYELEDKTSIIFKKVDNLFVDPVYNFLDSTDININGMPLSFFSDSLIGNLDNSTAVDIIIDGFYHPDFELIDYKVVLNDFDREDAKHGGKYFPHKDFVLDKLLFLYNKNTLPINIDRENINSNLISNYLVSYFNKDHKLIHHKCFTITNFDSYFKAKNKFLDNFNKLYLEEDLNDIRKFIIETNIVDRKSFLDYCYKFLTITLQKSIEFGGLHKSFWTDKNGISTPISEPAAQPIIYNLIRYLLEIKGIKVSRETSAADGSLDFHFYYNKDSTSMNVCVELKNAHHNNLEHGIKSQLPLYIKDVGNAEGIFMVLWYKSSEFNKPENFNTPQDLYTFLLSLIPKKFHIKPLIINCTKKVSPSKISSVERLNDIL